MLPSNLRELDALLSDDLLVTSPDGQLVGKAEDMAAHRTSALRITALVPQQTTCKLLPGVALVFVLMDMRGTFQARPFAGRYRYPGCGASSPAADRLSRPLSAPYRSKSQFYSLAF